MEQEALCSMVFRWLMDRWVLALSGAVMLQQAASSAGSRWHREAAAMSLSAIIHPTILHACMRACACCASCARQHRKCHQPLAACMLAPQ